MSLLNLFGRPFVMFDVANKDHRQHYYNFVKTGSWKDCPYRFEIEDGFGNLVGMIQVKLVMFYGSKEFKDVVKKPQTLVRQKKQKTVDNSTKR